MAVTLTIDAIRKRATKLAKSYENIKSEKQNDQNFMKDFCEVFGINSRRIEWQYKTKTINWVDGFIPGMLLFEMKSAGEDLDEAYGQAARYISQLKDKDLPSTVIVSDFQRIHVHQRESGERIEINLCDLPQEIDKIKFLAGYEEQAIQQEQEANEAAAEKMAGLHDAIKATGYTGKDLENYLVRLLFCLFADDTGLFGEKGLFLNYLNYTKQDGSDLHGELTGLFDTLNKPDDGYLAKYPDYIGPKRLKNLPEHRRRFPYINGTLFEGSLEQLEFDEATRNTLIECAKLDWSKISPAIFGSLFQAIMHFDDEAGKAKTKKRREFGAHYTSETNILKVIRSLFLESLHNEFIKARSDKNKLHAFHKRLATLNFFDPACGCGNFLVIAYRELRLLELEVIEILYGKNLTGHLDIDSLIQCNVNQFHGIEIDPSAVQIATVALWLTDHQMNLRVQRLGQYFTRIPLIYKANIVCANALRIDWNEVLPAERCSYVMGNPPFIGYSYQNKQQKDDLALVCQSINGAGVLDYVTAWYIKATNYIKQNPPVSVAFVSTNSICQGEQVSILWRYLFSQGIHIHFAHRTFRWSNEGRGIAAVHCVIVGFGLTEPKQRLIFDYGDDIAGAPDTITAKNINPYLVDAPIVFIDKRRKPMCAGVPEMIKGSQPTDGGHLLLTPDETEAIRQNDSIAAKYIRPFLGADEFINGLERYCLWLKDSTAVDRKASPEIQQRIKKVEAMRLASPKIPTQELAQTPYLFGEIRQTDQPYLLIPSVSSEQRRFVPIGYLQPEVIASNLVFMLPKATLYHFGILCSSMHNAWMRAVCGRLESRYRYSNTIVYNNFPWPESITDAQKKKIEIAAQQILDERQAEQKRCEANGQGCSLATLYEKGNMPAGLVKAHVNLDKAVDAAYGYKGKTTDAERVTFLFERYQAINNA